MVIYREKGVFGSEEIIQTYPNLYLTGQKDYTGCHTLNGAKQFVLRRTASIILLLYLCYTLPTILGTNKPALNRFIRANNISLTSDTIFTKNSFAK